MLAALLRRDPVVAGTAKRPPKAQDDDEEEVEEGSLPHAPNETTHNATAKASPVRAVRYELVSEPRTAMMRGGSHKWHGGKK